MKRILFVIILFSIVVFTSGCWDQKELEEYAFVVAIGIDKSEKNGLIEVTFQISNPQVGTTERGKADREPAKQAITYLFASDIVSAKDTANATISRQLTFEQLKMIIISEELAKKDEFLLIVSMLLRDTELRRGVHLMISKEKAKDFIRNNTPKMETRPHKFYQFMIEREKETGLVPDSDLDDFLEITEGDASLPIVMYGTTKPSKTNEKGYEDEYLPGQIGKEGGNVTQLIGSVVFKEGEMVGTLTGEETRLALVLNPYHNLSDFNVVYKDPVKPNYKIGARVLYSSPPDIKMDLKRTKPKIEVTVPINVELLSIPSYVDYIENLKNQELLKKSIEKGLEKKARKLIERTQKDFKGEPFLWSTKSRKHFLTWEEYKQFDWMKTYPEMEIDVQFEVTIRQFGKQLKEPDLKRVRD